MAYFGGLQSNNFEPNPLDWNWKSFNTYYSIFSSAITGYSFGKGIENYFYRKSYSKNLGEFMQKRSQNSDFTLTSLSNNEIESFSVRNYNYDELTGIDIMELYDLSYKEFNNLNPGTKTIWKQNEFFNVKPPHLSKMPYGWPPDVSPYGLGDILGFITNSPTAGHNQFVSIGGGKANRAYYRPNFGIWEWKWSIPQYEKQLTKFQLYTRARVGTSRRRWRGIYPTGSVFQTRNGVLTPESSLASLISILIQ